MRIALSLASYAAFALLSPAILQAQTVTGSGTADSLPMWRTNSTLGNSIISLTGTNELTVDGSLEAITTSGIGLEGTSASGFGVEGASKDNSGVVGSSTSGTGVSGHTGSGYGVQGQSNSSTGVFGISDSGFGVAGSSISNAGVEGTSNNNSGVLGNSKSGSGVEGKSDSLYGVQGTSTSSTGVVGYSTSGNGLSGHTDSGFGVQGQSTSSTGVFGISDSGFGVSGSSTGNVGVHGDSTSSNGVLGISTEKAGVVGENTDGDGIGGISCDSCDDAAVVGIGKIAGSFTGEVLVADDLVVNGLKAFHIDHPLDPANKYLNHFSVESNEVLDSYSGNVTTDGSGMATVELPGYFEALNKDYRYQLTVIGQFAQAIVREEIRGNRFTIETDKPSVKVSWQVMGVRSDASAKAHALPVEQEKPEQERGYYLSPELFGQPAEKSLTWLYHGYLMRDAIQMKQQRQARAEAARLHKTGEEESGAALPEIDSKF